MTQATLNATRPTTKSLPYFVKHGAVTYSTNSSVRFSNFAEKSIEASIGKKSVVFEGNTYASEIRANIFNYLTDHFEVEVKDINSIIHHIFKNKIQKSVMEKYLIQAKAHMDLQKTAIRLDDNEIGIKSVYLLCIPARSDAAGYEQFLDDYERYVTDFLFYRNSRQDGIEVILG